MTKVLVSPLKDDSYSLVVLGHIWCCRAGKEIPNYQILSADDQVVKWVLKGTKLTEAKFIDCDLTDLGYDYCDKVLD